MIWDARDSWRRYTASEAMSATLATRVELALGTCRSPSDQEQVCAALLAIRGAHLLAVDCDHGPGACEDGTGRN